MALPLVAIVGRPNVGKSTLVNRIAAKQLAIVDKRPGITRDRNYLQADWAGKNFTIIDTGGFDLADFGEIAQSVRNQVLLAIQEAKAIIFVVDGQTGPLPPDEEIAEILRPYQNSVLLVVNKIDSFSQEANIYQFYQLGLGEPIGISALHGLAIGDLLDKLVELLPEVAEKVGEEAFRIALVGRPNVGKSSIFNRLLGQERAIVSEIPGTTRDAIDTIVSRDGRRYCFVDTAGLKKVSRISEPVEYYGMVRALRALDRADLSLLVIDATTGATEQDQKIAALAASRGCASLILVNKWDLIEKETALIQALTTQVKEKLRFIDYAPLLTISALTGQRIGKIYALVDEIAVEYSKKVPTPLLNDFLQKIMASGYTVSKRGRRLKISYATQTRVSPPAFLFFANYPELVDSSYKRYLEGKLRETFGFTGCPIGLYFRKK